MNDTSIGNPFQACKEIILKPNHVFAVLKEKQNWSWIPFFLVIFMTFLPSYLYFDFVDFDWYVNQVVEAQYSDVSPSEQEMFRNSMTHDQVMGFTIFGSLFGSIIINAVLALYLNMSTKVDEENVHSFSDWYGFSWWISLPVGLGALCSLLVILLASDPQLSPTMVNPTSLGFVLGIDMSSDWFTLTQTIRLESFWTMYLIAVGVAQWVRVSSQQAYIIAVAPYAIIWGVWLAFIVF